MAGVRIPLIVLNAMDYPIAGGDNLPEEYIKKNPFTMLIETNVGGHLAWFKDLNGTRWFADPVSKFFSIFHNEITKKGFRPDVPEDQLPHEKVVNVRTTVDQPTL